MHWLSDFKCAMRLDGAGGKMVPASEVFDRNIEAVGDGDQRVARPRYVVQRMRSGDYRRHRNH